MDQTVIHQASVEHSLYALPFPLVAPNAFPGQPPWGIPACPFFGILFSCDKIIDIIHSEIRGLCQDGELLSIEKTLEEKRGLISKLQEELNDSTIHMCDTENEELDGEGDVILSEEDIEEESQSNDENLD